MTENRGDRPIKKRPRRLTQGQSADVAARPEKAENGRYPLKETIRYVVTIADWDWTFSFSANQQRSNPGLYQDFRHLEIRGLLMHPGAVNADSVELTFIPNSKLNEGRKQSEMSGWVGYLQLYQRRLKGTISMPSDALGPILQMLIARRFHHIDLTGAKLRHGKANLRGYRFERTIDENENSEL